MLFAGVLWFLPSIDGNDGYNKAYGGFTGTEPVGTGSAGTESVMPPLSSSQRAIVPTLRSNVSVGLNRTVSQPVVEPQQLEQEISRPKSGVEDAVVSRSNGTVGSQNSRSHNSNREETNLNTMRREKVVQVKQCVAPRPR